MHVSYPVGATSSGAPVFAQTQFTAQEVKAGTTKTIAKTGGVNITVKASVGNTTDWGDYFVSFVPGDTRWSRVETVIGIK